MPWWVQPLVVFLALSAFIVYATWAAFQGDHYAFGPYSLAVLLAGAVRRLAARLVRAEAGWWPGCAAVLAGAADPAGSRRASASPATTTAARTTRRSGPIRRPAPSASRARRYRGERSFPLILQNVHRYFLYLALVFLVLLAYDVWKALWFTDPATGDATFGIGVGTLVLARQRRPARRLHARLPLAAPPRRRLSSTSSRGAPVRQDGLRLRRAASTAAHDVGLVQPVLGRRSPTSTSGSARWASGTTVRIF